MSYIYFHTTSESAPQGSLEEDIFVIVILVPGALALGGFVIGIIICESKYFFFSSKTSFFSGVGGILRKSNSTTIYF